MTSPVPRGPAYRIHTQRLVVRCWEPRDAPLLKAVLDESLDHLRPWMPWAQNEPEPLRPPPNWQKRAQLLTCWGSR